MKNWKAIQPEALQEDAFTMIAKRWMLVTAQSEGIVNTMTASWGGVGVLWNKKVAFVFIRPQRYTKTFIDASDSFSLSFYDEEMRDTLRYLGTASGRDEDKIAHSGLHVTHQDNIPFFEEAKTVMLCRKLYKQDMQAECFIDKTLVPSNYPNNDYHTLYVVEIEQILIQA